MSLGKINPGIFVAGLPQPQRREGVRGRDFDAMPGGVGSFVEAELPCARNEFVVEDSTEEDWRRVQMFTVLPGFGTGRTQVYGLATARDDGDTMFPQFSVRAILALIRQRLCQVTSILNQRQSRPKLSLEIG